MAGTRMRLTVLVEALAEENAHGEYREMALAALKERRFAMPAELNDTFETVWRDIEQRYKTNYLAPHQAATFSIKKLQDAYDCDLDMNDTVGAIFEGEPDRKLHMIKVVPHFAYRETSVVPGSMLRPQKRLGDDLEGDLDASDNTNKRRRIESQQRQSTHEAQLPSPNRPIPSTEALSAPATATAGASHTGGHSVRSPSGQSLVELSRTETGQAPFSADHVKQESPGPAEPSQPPHTGTQDAAPAVDHGAEQHEHTAPPQHIPSPQHDSHEAAIHRSPISSDDLEPEHESDTAVAPTQTTRISRDVYRVPDSPDFMHKKVTPDKHGKTTYGRSSHSGADLLNMARRLGRTVKQADTQTASPASIPRKHQPLQRMQPDEIESTPQEDASRERRKHSTNDKDQDDAADLTASFLDEAAGATPSHTHVPARKHPVKSVKPGSLKKPLRASLTTTPAMAKRGAESKSAAKPTPVGPTSNSSAADAATVYSASLSRGKNSPDSHTMSRMERLQMIMSQGTPTSQGNASSPARSGSCRSRERSNRLSPEVRIPVTKKITSFISSSESPAEPITVHAETVQPRPTKNSTSLPTSSTKNRASATIARSIDTAKALETVKLGLFKKPAPTARESPAQPIPAKKVSVTPRADVLRRSEVPLPPNVRHLRRSSSLQSSPRARDDTSAINTDCNLAPKPLADSQPPILGSKAMSPKTSEAYITGSTSSAKLSNGAIVISSAEPSSLDYSSSEDGDAKEDKPATDVAGGQKNESHSSAKMVNTKTRLNAHTSNAGQADQIAKQPNEANGHNEPNCTPVIPGHTQEHPPSGQVVEQAEPWNAASCNFGQAGRTAQANDQHGSDQVEQSPEATNTAPVLEDETLAEQEIYSTAIEDNASRSRSSSAVGSTRSSPAVSRRPARFLSHSPTPDTSESEDDSDEASAVASRGASTQVNGKDETESESDSSSDSSDDDMANPPAASAIGNNTIAAPPSSPPLNDSIGSTPVVSATSQSTSSHIKPPMQRTPVPPPTQQSSQAPRSSQSVSVQAAERRRYTGFRSLREQLADTKTAQVAAQKKVFDPRMMSLGKLTKGKPITSLEDDESSDDDSSSSSSSSESD
ncbi:hypothetical protein G6514_001904 [Epicoccum nigrum]|nr:hypothetical protein G6514_001904 [Epicoccum nigrum]